MTQTQRSVAIGTVMGDATLAKSLLAKNASLVMKHSAKQVEWLWWKFKKLGGQQLFTSGLKRVVNVSRGREHDQFYVLSHADPVFSDLRDWFYSRRDSECGPGAGKKRITQEILDQVDDLALAVWFGDDGTKIGSGIGFVVGNVPESEMCLVREWFEGQGLRPKLRLSSNRRWGYIVFGKTDALKLVARLHQNLPPQMRYKTIGPFGGNRLRKGDS